MRAARLHACQKPLVIEDIPIPEPGYGEVLVRIEGAGFCHSDVHIIDGELSVQPALPITLGHENAGRVAAVGPGVEEYREGQPVAVFGGWGCGRCDLCVTGDEQLCPDPRWSGIFGHDGGYAEYMLVPRERYLVHLDTLEPRVAAPLTDAALTPYRAIRKALPFIEPGYPVLLIGLGGLGTYGLKLLQILTGSDIIVVDVTERKLEVARELDATHVLDGRESGLADRVKDLTGGRGVSAAFDFVGSDATLELAVRSTRSLGKVSQIGLAGGTAHLKVLENSRFEVLFEATLWGTVKELREVVALVESGRLEPIAIEFAPLEGINEVYRRVKGGEAEGRIVITP